MDDLQLKIVLSILLMALLILSGIRLRRKARPYKTALFTVHKLTAIGVIILIWIILKTILNDPVIKGISQATIISAIIIALISFISGALQSFEKAAPGVIVISHKISSYLVIILILYKLITYIY